MGHTGGPPRRHGKVSLTPPQDLEVPLGGDERGFRPATQLDRARWLKNHTGYKGALVRTVGKARQRKVGRKAVKFPAFCKQLGAKLNFNAAQLVLDRSLLFRSTEGIVAGGYRGKLNEHFASGCPVVHSDDLINKKNSVQAMALLQAILDSASQVLFLQVRHGPHVPRPTRHGPTHFSTQLHPAPHLYHRGCLR